MGLSGRHLGQYQIRNEIGRGGMGTVYRAYDGDAGREVAIKVLPAQLIHEPGFLERFKNEGRIIARLEHPHILPLYAVGEADGYPYLAMRYVGGGSLRDRLDDGPVDTALLLKTLPQIADALDEAHRHGIVHRDIKPGNILLDHNDNAYLADFGISKMLEGSAHFTSEGGIVGTPAYMAPEQWRGDELDARADVYALGCVVFETLTGQTPYKATNAAAFMTKHLTEPVPSARKTNANLPPALDALLQQAMSKDAASRPASASEFAGHLSATLQGIDWDPTDIDTSKTMRMETTRPSVMAPRKLTYAIGGVLGVAALVIGVLLMSGTLGKIGDSLSGRPDGSEEDARIAPVTDLSLTVSAVTLTGHSGSVTEVAWSPDSQQLASASQDGTLIIWDVETRTPLHTLGEHNGWVTTVDWSADGTRLASGSLDNTLIVWDAETGETLFTLEGHTRPVTSVDWSPDSTLVASASEDTNVILWDATTGNLVRTLEGHSNRVTDVAWVPSLSPALLASVSQDGTFITWNPLMGDIVRQQEVAQDAVNEVEWIYGRAGQSMYLVTGSTDGLVRIWDGSTLVGELANPIETSVVGLATWSQQSLIAATYQPCSTAIVDFISEEVVLELGGCPTDIAWSPDGQYIAMALPEGLVRVYDVGFLTNR